SLHADGSREPANKQIAELLNQLLLDAGAAGSVHAAHVRGCRRWPDRINRFTIDVLSPYMNYHRLRMFAVEHVGAEGRARRTYPYDAIATPYEKFKSLSDAASQLKPGLDFQQLDAIAYAHSDNEAAR